MPLLKAPEGGVIALGGEWNASPRRARLTSTDQPVFIKAVAEFLEARGLKEPKVNITQIVRVDLDGGGEEDVLISGTNYFSKEGRLSRTIPAGSYSFVLLRRTVRNSVQTQLIEGEFHPQTKTEAYPRSWISMATEKWRSSFLATILKAIRSVSGVVLAQSRKSSSK